jgi:hypothetical protein
MLLSYFTNIVLPLFILNAQSLFCSLPSSQTHNLVILRKNKWVKTPIYPFYHLF